MTKSGKNKLLSAYNEGLFLNMFGLPVKWKQITVKSVYIYMITSAVILLHLSLTFALKQIKVLEMSAN